MNKQDILDHYMSQVEKVKQGGTNALDVGADLKEFSDALSGLYDELKDHIVEERDKYSQKEDVVRNGYEIRNMSRTYYKYKQDGTYDFINQKLKNRKNFIKKATDKGEPIDDPSTGEVIEPVETSVSTYPVLKYVGEQI